MTSSGGSGPFVKLPDPGEARSMDGLIKRLRLLKTWAGEPSYSEITARVNEGWRAAGLPAREWMTAKATVASCFTLGRRRPNDDLVIAIVRALHPDVGYVTQWQQALRVVRGEATAATFVKAQAELPADLPEFAGREAEMAELTSSLAAGTTVVISAIEGMAGVGKSLLAIHASHQLIRRGDLDQVLFVNLRGFHPDLRQPPVEPAAVLDGFLRLLGVPGQQIPHDLAGRVSMNRQQLHERRVLVVLDNAANSRQVLPLLPHGRACLTIITTRRTLDELPANARRLQLDVFTPAEALEYLRRAVGEDRINADADTAAHICEATGYLPLALGLTASQIAAKSHSKWTLTDHLRRLIARRRDLRLDDTIDISFRLSYEDLPADVRRTLRLMSLHPGTDLDVYTLAAMTGTTKSIAQTHVEHLVTNHLLQQKASDRYELHDLVRAYAIARALDEDSYTDQRAALTQLINYYAHSALSAAGTLFPYEPTDEEAPPASIVPDLTVIGAARTWLDAERANLISVVELVQQGGWRGYAGLFLGAMHRYLETTGRFDDSLTLLELILSIVEEDEEPSTRARALNWTGVIYFRQGRYALASEYYRRALREFRRVGDMTSEGRVLNNLAGTEMRSGNIESALRLDNQSLTIHRRTGDRLGEGHTLNNIGFRYMRAGRYAEALAPLTEALQIFQGLADRSDESIALGNLGVAFQHTDHPDRAFESFQAALEICRQTNDQATEGDLLKDIADLYRSLGQQDAAAEYLLQALEIGKSIGDRILEIETLNRLGETLRSQGLVDEATEKHHKALEGARGIGNREEEARAHHGLGHLSITRGNPDSARSHWRRAIDLYSEMGYPQAEELRIHMTVLDQSQD